MSKKKGYRDRFVIVVTVSVLDRLIVCDVLGAIASAQRTTSVAVGDAFPHKHNVRNKLDLFSERIGFMLGILFLYCKPQKLELEVDGIATKII